MKFLPARPIIIDLLVLLALALIIRALTALPQQQPNYMDAAYYYVNALNLAQGRGFVEDFIWLYLDNPASLPHPSHLYWMPLTSILAWWGMVIGGESYRAAQIFFVALSALLAPLTYGVTYLLARQRWSGWLAGLLAIFSGFYFPFWTAIDNFTPFALAGSLALLTAWVGMNNEQLDNEQLDNEQLGNEQIGNEQLDNEQLDNEQLNNQQLCNETIHNSQFTINNSRLILVLSGIFVGLAHLSRADGPLLLVAVIFIYFLNLIFNPKFAPRTTRHILRFVLPLILGYLLIMTPWLVRNWQAVGTPFPTAGAQSIWLAGYDELFSYGRELSPQTFLAQGFGPILQGRWWALTTNLQTVLAVWGMIFLLPPAVVGFWVCRRHLLFQLAALYAVLLFGVMTLIFAFPGARGGLFHSGAALLPYIYAAGVIGLDQMVDWLAARRRRWHAQAAKRFFAVGLVVMAILLSCFIYYQRVIKNNAWNRADQAYAGVAGWVLAQDPAAIVMINNPPAYRYHGGGLSVVVPNEDIDTTLQAARRYHVDYLILGPNDPALADIYYQTAHHPQLMLVQNIGDIKIFEIVTP